MTQLITERYSLLARLPLRVRLMLAVGIMILPMLALAAAGYWWYSRAMTAFDEAAVAVLDDLFPIMEVQFLLQQVPLPVTEYLDTGDARYRSEFARLAQRIDSGFAAIVNAPMATDARAELLREARDDWRTARGTAEDLLASARRPLPLTGEAAVERLLNQLLHDAAVNLQQVYHLVRRDFIRHHNAARATRRQIHMLIAGALLAAVLAGAGIIAVVARSIVAPLRDLREGAERLAAGQLDHRIPITTDDELAQLARGFNRMAEELESDREELQRLATHDHLTGLYNKREFVRRLREELERAQRYRHGLGVMILDIDHFKQVNDTYGHLVGDEAIRLLAGTLFAVMRPSDIAARYGGEEFVIILPEADLDHARAAAERVRLHIEARPLPLSEDEEVNLTVSVGVAAYPEHGNAAEPLVRAADRALYAAKNAGRNCVRTAGQ